MKKIILALALTTLIAGCSTTVNRLPSEPPKSVVTEAEFTNLTSPANGPTVVAVYSFEDKTGQRLPSDKIANISTAVTQGAEQYVIKALRDVGNGTWFKVVERVGLENLARERQIIRQTREEVGDTTPFRKGLDDMRTQTKAFAGSVKGMLAGAIGVGSIALYRYG